MILKPEDIDRAAQRERQIDELRKSAVPLKDVIVQQVKLGVDLKYLSLRYSIAEERLVKMKEWLEARAEQKAGR